MELQAFMNSLKNQLNNRSLILCFQVHQPCRFKKLAENEPGIATQWLDEELNRTIMERVARECYLPTNALLLKLIEQYPQIKISFSISGTALEQMEMYTPKVLESFKTLAATGSVDFLAETYHHSMAFLMEGQEFEIQILEHAEKIVEHFGIRPTVFRNTNMFYNDDIGRRVTMMGFQGVLTEGNADAVGDSNPHYLYEHRDQNGLKILLRNSRLSDDIAFRVALKDWSITAEKYMSWLEAMPEDQKLVTIALDYETFGEHHKKESEIFHFLEHLLLLLAIENSYRMMTPAELVQQFDAAQPISIPDYVAVGGSDLADLVGNENQREAFTALITLEAAIKSNSDSSLLKLWRCLQASDHLYYMSDKAYQANHLSPYSSPQGAFEHYMHVIQSLQRHIHDNDNKEIDLEKTNEELEVERRQIEAPLWALNIDSRSGHHH